LAQIQGLRNGSFILFYLFIFKKNVAKTISRETKRGGRGGRDLGPKGRPKDAQLEGPKYRERPNLSCGRKLSHLWPL